MSHRQLLRQIVNLSLVVLLLAGCAGAQDTEPKDSTRVLFIGNSLTFFNDLPEMFAELARSGGHEVDADMSAQGGWTLSDHATSKKTLDKIEQQNWDFVVLQEQSAIPSIVDERNKSMYPAARLLDSKIRESGAATIFYMTWGYRDGSPEVGYKDFDAMQAQLYSGYMGIADELEAMVAPVGVAWQNGMAQDPQLDLWQGDGLHPNREGSYLAACVFYAVIYQQSPKGLKYTAELVEEKAQFLQDIAAETVLENPERWNIAQ